jgi:DnaJ-class molecular chaperone
VTGHFEFDQQRTHGTNRAATQECATCDGHRLVPKEHPPECDLSHPSEGGISARSCDCGIGDAEVYIRCPSCNPAPVTERQPVDGRWKTYDR